MRSKILERIYKKSSKAFVIKMIGAGALFGLQILISNQLGAEQYGLYSFAMAVAVLIAAVASLGLPTGLMRFVSQYREHGELGRLKGIMYRAPLVCLGSTMLVSALVLWLTSFSEFGHDLTTALWLAGFLLPAIVLSQLRANLYRAFRKPLTSIMPDEIVRPVVLGMAIIALGVSSTGAVVSLYAVISIILAAIFLLWLYGDTKSIYLKEEAAYDTAYWIRISLPMVIGYIGYMVLSRSDIIMLGVMEDMKVVGVYSAANRVATLVQFVLGAAAVVVTPLLTSAYHGQRLDELRSIMRHTRAWILFLTLPLVVLMVLVPGMFLVLFGSEYVDGSWVLRILALGQLVHAVAGPVGAVLFMTGKQNIMAVTMIVVALVNLALNYMLIPLYGAIGAACATAFCLVVSNCFLVFIINRSSSYHVAK